MNLSDRMPLGAMVFPKAFVMRRRTPIDKETKEMNIGQELLRKPIQWDEDHKMVRINETV